MHIESQLSRRTIGSWRKPSAQQRELFRIEPAWIERIEVRLSLRTTRKSQDAHPPATTCDVHRQPESLPRIGRQHDDVGPRFTKTTLQLGLEIRVVCQESCLGPHANGGVGAAGGIGNAGYFPAHGSR